MGLFGRRSKKDKMILRQLNEIARLTNLSEEKDEYFKEMISDGLRHGSSLAGKHMADRKKYLNSIRNK